MTTIWHFEQLASGPAHWPRRLHPALFDDDRADARGYPGLVADRAGDIDRRVVEARLAGIEVGFLFWCPGGVTHTPAPGRPEHFTYPDAPFRAAREHVAASIERRASGADGADGATDPATGPAVGSPAPMRKAGDTAAFASACRRLQGMGVRRVGVYIGRPGNGTGLVPPSTAADPDLVELVGRGLVTDVMLDASGQQPPLPVRERAMRAYEAAGADVWYEGVPTWAGPGSDLRHTPRGAVNLIGDWEAVQARELGQPYHPARNVPAGFFPRALILDTRDDPAACRAHVAAGRAIAINMAAPAWRAVNLMDLWAP